MPPRRQVVQKTKGEILQRRLKKLGAAVALQAHAWVASNIGRAESVSGECVGVHDLQTGELSKMDDSQLAKMIRVYVAAHVHASTCGKIV